MNKCTLPLLEIKQYNTIDKNVNLNIRSMDRCEESERASPHGNYRWTQHTVGKASKCLQNQDSSHGSKRLHGPPYRDDSMESPKHSTTRLDDTL